MLQLQAVTKTFGANTAVHAASFSVDRPMMIGIIGSSGAGKSTLLHMLGALDTPTSGSIRFNDVEVTTLDDNAQSDFRRHQVGFVFQFFNLLPTMSAWENVAVPKLLDGTPIKKARSDALRLLDMVGLSHRSEHRPAQLSGGQIQRIAIARALMMDPALLIADEPTGNLDSKTSHTVLEMLADVAHASDGRRAVVMATHDLDAAHRTDRIVSMLDGRVESDTPTAGLDR